ncbi:DUF3386 family protein [Nitrospira defluvii]|nr:DUF3386 family protein [Nitrospira defluvii]
MPHHDQTPHHGIEGVKTDVQNDPAAKELLRQAFESTSRWGKDFPGFAADLICNDNGEIYKGSVEIKSKEELSINLEVPEGKKDLNEWVQETIGMMVVHRAWRSFEESDGKSPITFAEENNDHPLGRQLLIHSDGMASRYRIKDNRIQQISRDMGRMRFTINIEEAMKTEDGKSLTTQYVVFYFTGDNKLMKIDSFTDEYHVLDGNYLPAMRRVISSKEGKVVVRVLEFKGHRLLS